MSKILIVDDSPAELEFTATILRAGGHDIVKASNGTEALRCLEYFRPDLIITDIYMPECDGIELILQLRRKRTKIPIIAVSGGCTRQQNVLLSMMPELGADLALAKPLSASVLITAVTTLIGGRVPAGEVAS